MSKNSRAKKSSAKIEQPNVVINNPLVVDNPYGMAGEDEAREEALNAPALELLTDEQLDDFRSSIDQDFKEMANEAGPELPAEDAKLTPIEEEIQTPAPTGSLLKVVVTTQRAAHGTPGSVSSAKAVPAEILAELKKLGLNTCNQVKTLYANGFSRAEIVASGYNSSTVYRQVKEYIDGKKVTAPTEAFDKAVDSMINSDLAEDTAI